MTYRSSIITVSGLNVASLLGNDTISWFTWSVQWGRLSIEALFQSIKSN